MLGGKKDGESSSPSKAHDGPTHNPANNSAASFDDEVPFS
jgi:hypothetical protein